MIGLLEGIPKGETPLLTNVESKRRWTGTRMYELYKTARVVKWIELLKCSSWYGDWRRVECKICKYVTATSILKVMRKREGARGKIVKLIEQV